MKLRILRASAALVAATFSVMAVVAGVSAHAEFESSVPTAGSTVATSPPTVSVTFNAEIQRVAGSFSLDVTSPGGTSATSGDAAVGSDDMSISVALQPNLPAGTYTVDWTNTMAEDGDTAEGSFTFAIGAAPVAQPTTAPTHTHDDTEMGHDSSQDGSFAPPTTGLFVIHLDAQGDSLIDGRAEIIPVDGGAKTQIGIFLSNTVAGSMYPAHVHEQVSCSDEEGPHVANLDDVMAEGATGGSTTIVDVPFSVVASGEHLIMVHQDDAAETVAACGLIPAQPPGADHEHGQEVMLPSTGTGSGTEAIPPYAAPMLALVGVVFVSGAFAVRRHVTSSVKS